MGAAGPSQPDPLIGQQVGGRYEVVRLIGRGGMGAIFEVHNTRVGRSFAMKTLTGASAADATMLARFRREAEVVARIKHPNIVEVIDWESLADGSPCIILEYLAGEDLAQRIGRCAPLPWPFIARIGDQLSSALAVAHAVGVVHRDLKPQNVFLAVDDSGEERAKLLDFGVSKIRDSASLITTDARLLGTPAYMAPEQAEGSQADIGPATDLWALGAILYEMATGELAFSGPTLPAILYKICSKDADPVDARRRDAPVAFAQLVRDLLTRDLASRIGDANVCRRRLREALGEIAPEVRYTDQLAIARPTPRSLDFAPSRNERPVSGHDATVASGAFDAPASSRRNSEPAAAALADTADSSPAVNRPRRRWLVPALAAVAIAALASITVWQLGRDRNTATSAASSEQVRAVAVVGFRNLSGRPDTAWLSTALTEMLRAQLGAGEDLRTIPGEGVARMKLELQLPEVDGHTKETLARIRANSGADLVVVGAYLALGGGDIEITVRVEDTSGGDTVAVVTGSGREQELATLVSVAGANIRAKIGARRLGQTEDAAARFALPTDAEAARYYADGLARLRIFDAAGAQRSLAEAVAREPGHALTRSALAAAWLRLGYDRHARDEAKAAFERAAGLGREERSLIEGVYRETEKDWDGAIAIYRALWKASPDDLEHGLRVARVQNQAARARDALTTIAALRALPAPMADDPRIDLEEAKANFQTGEYGRSKEIAAAAANKAAQKGASLLVAQARLLEGQAAVYSGDHARGRAALTESRRLYGAGGDRGGVAAALTSLSTVSQMEGDVRGSRDLAEEALRIAREIGDKRREATLVNNAALIDDAEGRWNEAARKLREAYAVTEALGDHTRLALFAANVAEVALYEGNLPEARRLAEQGRELATEISDSQAHTFSLTILGRAALAGGERDRALALADEAIEVARGTNTLDVMGDAIELKARIALTTGDLESARKLLEEATKHRLAIGDRAYIARGRLAIAELALETGPARDAAQLTGTALEEFDRELYFSDRLFGLTLHANALLADGRLAEAESALKKADALAPPSLDHAGRHQVAWTRARILARQGKAAEAIPPVEASIAELTRAGLLVASLEARVVLGEVELAAARAGARKRLAAVAAEARAKGLLRVARAADALVR